MRCIKGRERNVFFNFACEEYFMDHFEEPIFMLWENSNCVMVGKTQNTYAEVNTDYAKEHDIAVVRRQSGGGTIYTSQGIIQFTFILKVDKTSIEEKMREFTIPFVKYLESIGIKAEFSGRNDVLIDGMKINGNAQAYKKDIMLHHGSILFDADLSHAVNVLTPKKEKLEAKGIKSVKSRMTLIKNHLPQPLTTTEFFDGFFDYVVKSVEGAKEVPLTQEEIKGIESLQKDKWESWEWNYGKNPQFNMQRSKKFKGGLLELLFEVKKGKIENITIYGDFFGKKEVSDLETALKACPHNKEAITKALNPFNLDEYMHNITLDDFLELILD